MEKMLDGKVAIITGSGRGIGKAAALLFAQEGAKVVVSDIDPAPAEETVAEIKKAGGRAYLAFSHRRKPFRCWIIDISDYLYLEKIWREQEGRKSIPIESIAKVGYQVKRINIKTVKRRKGKKGWKIAPVFDRRESLEC